MNIWDDDLEPFVDERSFGSGRKRLLSFDGQLGASVWEIAPGKTQIPYHFQHVQEELLLVLRGRPILRTPDGERTLAEGDVAYFPTGPTGAHALRNVHIYETEAWIDILHPPGRSRAGARPLGEDRRGHERT